MTPIQRSRRVHRNLPLLVSVLVSVLACDSSSRSPIADARSDAPSPPYRNVATSTAYVGDSACAACHVAEATAYRQHSMAQSFHRWTPATRIEAPLDTPLYHARSGYSYSIVDVSGQLYQAEFLVGPGGKHLHELRRRMDYVMGSGHVARSYFTELNGRLLQLPLTWYRRQGWDFSPGYQFNNGRFDRLMPNRCIACHSSYPDAIPFVEGKYATLRAGIGCERCHGPGALHVKERTAGVRPDSGYDKTIVNPARLPLQRRVDVCEQCHVHTSVAVLREGKNAFSYQPSQPLHDQWAFFKVSGSIDIVSHADRLRQSKCYIATRDTSRPLECATCHDPHQPPPDLQARNQPCQNCHSPSTLEQRLARSPARAAHTRTADCVSCHMPKVLENAVHGVFTEHWIRIVTPGSERPTVAKYADGPIEPYFARDKRGPAAKVYQGMGEIVYATLSNNSHVLADGIAGLDSALGKDTTRADAHFLLGVAYQQLGETDNAIRALAQSVRIDSNRPEPLRALAQSYERAGRASGDIDHLYRRALAVQPALAWIRAEYADFLDARGLPAAAERAYRLALAEQPDLAVAWFNLGTVLTEERKASESARAFREAVHLDPAFAQALSPLIEMYTNANDVLDVKALQSPLRSLPPSQRGSLALQVAVATVAGHPGVVFLGVPARGFVEILKPDDSLLRSLPTGEGGRVSWDLLTETAVPVAGGLYRARVMGRDASGRPVAQVMHLGIVRRRAG